MTTSIQAPIINFRKMKQDFAQNVLRDGKVLFDKKVVLGAKVVDIGVKSIKVHAKVQGAYANSYECDLEIDRSESVILDASCDCPHNFDCQHIACVLFHLENEMENLLVDFSKERKGSSEPKGSGSKSQSSKQQVEKKSLAEEAAVHDVLRHAEKKVQEKQERELEKHLLQEYLTAAHVLGKSPFFIPEEEIGKDLGELLFLFQPHEANPGKLYELQIILRLPFRSKPFYIQQAKQFLAAVQSEEPFIIGQNRHVFGIDSFGPLSQDLLKAICQYVHFTEGKSEKGGKVACFDREGFGEFLTVAFEKSNRDLQRHFDDGRSFCLPNIFWGSIEKPMRFFEERAALSFKLDLMREPKPHVVMSPKVIFPDQVPLEATQGVGQVQFLVCSRPGVFFEGCYLRFTDELKRQHLHELGEIEKMSIPEALFGSFVENALPELHRFAKIENPELLDQLVTYPYSDDLKAVCDLHYASGELEARLAFVYGSVTIPEASQQFTVDHIKSFVTDQGVLSRNLCEENALVRELFHGFLRDEKQGIYVAKTEKKIVEFMTEVIPANSHRVSFSCPESLLNQFSYDDTTLKFSLSEGSSFDKIKLQIRVDGILSGISCDYLWDCVSARKPYVVLAKSGKVGGKESLKFIREESDDEVLQPTQKILVIKLGLWERILHIFDELELKRIEDVVCEIPLWLLLNLPKERFEGLPVAYLVSKRLSEIQKELFSMSTIDVPAIPGEIKTELRHYQIEGVNWLSRLRHMGLNGILADDMGLGKTLQTICAITHYVKAYAALPQAEGSKGKPVEDKSLPAKNLFPKTALIVCPTSLVDNWKEEFIKFNPDLRVITLSGTPQERKKTLQLAAQYDVLITSYGLVQKDIEQYEKLAFSYLILDEAQYIKNRETRNARSVKKIPARHRLILTGTPLENSLADLWSLFDFLMPGLLGSFERFSEVYIRPTGKQLTENLTILQKKIAPFVLRRMKQDVLKDLPPISHIVYHCHLTESQDELYRSYVKSARDELIKLVEREGYDKVKLHVLATLTRLKQICCHPAIFAKDKAAPGDSAKYEMFLDLLGNLIESKRKTVVFSQYTAMLGIMKEDLLKMNARLVYLDGATKNRMSLVKQFNEDPNTTIFLISLKAGGNGLNLVGADTVIHYDMWWNPAVENQATARVWRMGQKQPVSSYKLVTSGTVEEKIIALQEKKKELLNDIVRTDEEVISKLSWDEVLELLKA